MSGLDLNEFAKESQTQVIEKNCHSASFICGELA